MGKAKTKKREARPTASTLYVNGWRTSPASSHQNIITLRPRRPAADMPLVKLNVRMKYRDSVVAECRDLSYDYKAALVKRVTQVTQSGLKITMPKHRRIKVGKGDVIRFYYEAEMPNENTPKNDESRARRRMYTLVTGKFPFAETLLDELQIEYIHLTVDKVKTPGSNMASQLKLTPVVDAASLEDATATSATSVGHTMPDLDSSIEGTLSRIEKNMSRYRFPLLAAEHQTDGTEMDVEEGEVITPEIIRPPELGELLIEAAIQDEQALLSELATVRAQVWDGMNLESRILNALRALGNNKVRGEKSFHELHDLLHAETRRRTRAESLLAEVERECKDPFVVPALLKAFAIVSDVSSKARTFE